MEGGQLILKIIMYFHYINEIGGIETYMYNWCMAMHESYDIKILYGAGDVDQIKRIYQYADIEKINHGKKYYCDILISNQAWDRLPQNISVAVKSYKVLHSDYSFLSISVVKDADDYIAVSQHVADVVGEKFGIHPIVISPFMAEKTKPRKILRLVSLTRLTSEKGTKRILPLIELFKKYDIPFEWKIFSDTPGELDDIPEIIVRKPTLDVATQLSGADYLVQLSDTESFCYSIREALQYGVAVICTDIPVLRDIIIDGYNGYKVPLDLSNVDVLTIYEKIPKNFVYEFDNDAIKKQWSELLGEPSVISRPIKKDVTVKSIDEYYDLTLGRQVNRGEIFKVDPLRAIELSNLSPNHPEVCVVVED